MPSAATLDLSRIYRSPVFRSRSSVESHRELTTALSDHRLRWGRGDVATALHRRDLQHISLMILTYGAEVEVVPAPFEDFVLVQMVLRGTAEVESDGMPLRIGYGEMAVLAPRRSVRLLWQPGCEQLIVKLPHALLRRAANRDSASSPCDAGAPSHAPLWSRPASKVEPAIAAQWLGLLQQLLSLLPGDADAAHPSWLGPFEQAAALFLHSHQAAAGSARCSVASRDCLPVDADGAAVARLTRLEEHIRSRAFAPLSLADLARIAGVTTRTLNTLCQRHRGVSPMELLRNLRLEGSRAKLQSQQRASVTDVALEHGFGHLGRFSAYYRERFGELPRQTCKQA